MGRPIVVKLTSAEQLLAQKTTGSIGNARAKLALLKALGAPLENWEKPFGFIIKIGFNKLVLFPDAKLLERYILMSGTAVEMVVWGWMWGYEAMTEEFAAGDKCIVPGERLNDIMQLKDEIFKKLDCAYTSVAEEPAVDRSTGVRFSVGAPNRLGVNSQNTGMSRQMRFALFDIEWYLKTESPLMKELTILAMRDKEWRFTSAGKLKKEPKR
jgi:hypothetical protein